MTGMSVADHGGVTVHMNAFTLRALGLTLHSHQIGGGYRAIDL